MALFKNRSPSNPHDARSFWTCKLLFIFFSDPLSKSSRCNNSQLYRSVFRPFCLVDLDARKNRTPSLVVNCCRISRRSHYFESNQRYFSAWICFWPFCGNYVGCSFMFRSDPQYQKRADEPHPFLFFLNVLHS